MRIVPRKTREVPIEFQTHARERARDEQGVSDILRSGRLPVELVDKSNYFIFIEASSKIDHHSSSTPYPTGLAQLLLYIN